ncbi:hypothetical protein [Beijerinckia indica]|uniref:hypothetical protein n=1 Tax=Beijerinckia indica TaxID=533 RepID=UPI0011D0BF47|nr:hypothetical protein [Beijerinckia indica]
MKDDEIIPEILKEKIAGITSNNVDKTLSTIFILLFPACMISFFLFSENRKAINILVILSFITIIPFFLSFVWWVLRYPELLAFMRPVTRLREEHPILFFIIFIISGFIIFIISGLLGSYLR